MRIRKRAASTVMPPPLPHLQQPIVFKLQARSGDSSLDAQRRAECSNMQENRWRLESGADHEAPASPQSSSDVYAEPPAVESTQQVLEAHVKDDHSDGEMSGSLEEDHGTGNGRRKKQQSPTKRRKIEHESSLVFEGPSSMTAAELLAVTELANGVRQRLAASEHSTSEMQVVTKAVPAKPVENSKDALISSIFYVFDVCGENGLSASEVVKYMLDHRLPGLKEGGARHTVQVANVLRSSTSFISLGDKKYLLCSALDHDAKKPTGSSRPVTHIKIIAPASPQHSSDDDQTLNPSTTPRRGKARTDKANAQSSTRSGKKVQAEKPKTPPPPPPPPEGSPRSEEAAVVKTTRRRGPSSSQKGKGPTQCKRYDGRGWQCSRLTEPGYSLCVHHQDLINKRAAKLKEQQTLNRLLESQHRKLAKSQTPSPPSPIDTPTIAPDPTLTNPRDRDAPVQKRKMLSLLAIK